MGHNLFSDIPFYEEADSLLQDQDFLTFAIMYKEHKSFLNHFSDVSDVEVDRDEDSLSPQPHIQYNGMDGGFLEVPPEAGPPPTNNMSLPGSPQKKIIQPVIEEEDNEEMN